MTKVWRNYCVLAVAVGLGWPGVLRADSLDDDLAAAKQLLIAGKDEAAAGRLDALEARARIMASSSPSDAHVQYVMGMAAMYAGHDEAAQGALDRAVRLAPTNATYVMGRAQLAMYQDKPGEAAAMLAKYVKPEEKNIEVWEMLAEAQAGAGQFGAAQESYQKAAGLAPKAAKYVLQVGQMLAKQQKYAEALAAFQKVLEMDAKSNAALANIAQAYEAQKDLDKALETYAKMLALDANDYRAASKQVQLYQALGKTKERDAARERIIAIRKAGKMEAESFCREQYVAPSAEKSNIIVMEYFELKPPPAPRAVRYAFNVLTPDGKSLAKLVSLGSYLESTALAREQGQIGAGERLFHLDVYIDEEHQVLKTFTKEPTYEEARELVNQYLAGTLKPLPAASKPSAPTAAPLPAGGR